MARGGRGQRQAAQSAQLQLWPPPMVLSLLQVVRVSESASAGRLMCQSRSNGESAVPLRLTLYEVAFEGLDASVQSAGRLLSIRMPTRYRARLQRDHRELLMVNKTDLEGSTHTCMHHDET